MNIYPLIEDFQITSGKSFFLSNMYVCWIFGSNEFKTSDRSVNTGPTISNCLKPHIIFQEGVTKSCCVLCLEQNPQKGLIKSILNGHSIMQIRYFYGLWIWPRVYIWVCDYIFLGCRPFWKLRKNTHSLRKVP